MPTFWQDLCCCFSFKSASSIRKDFEGAYSSHNYKTSESDTNLYGNSFSFNQSYGGTGTTVHSLNSLTNGTNSNSNSNNNNINNNNYNNNNNGLHNNYTAGITSLMGFYRAKPKSPRELVKALKYYLNKYDLTMNSISLSNGGAKEQSNKSITKLSLELAKIISALKSMTLQSEEDVQLRGDYDLQMFLIKEIYESNLLEILCLEIEKFPFEARKEAVIIFNSLLRRQIPPNRQIVGEHLRDFKRELLKNLLDGYDRPERTLHYGLMLRECIKFEFLCEIILNLPEFDKLFDYIQLPTFDVSSDAFATFKDLLTRHKNLVGEYLVKNYENLFGRLNNLLISDNYVTRRQSLKLLGEILHDRRNYEVMLRYVSEVENLKLLMIQLRDKSEKIQFEAFQVFKIFIANPNKPKLIYDILCKNRDKILHFLENFSVQGKQMDDRNFNEDKLFLIEKLQLLPQYQKQPHQNHQNTQSSAQCSESLDPVTIESLSVCTGDHSCCSLSNDSINVIDNNGHDPADNTESLILSRSDSVLSVSMSVS